MKLRAAPLQVLADDAQRNTSAVTRLDRDLRKP